MLYFLKNVSFLRKLYYLCGALLKNNLKKEEQ